MPASVVRSVVYLFLLVVVGCVGYQAIEGWGWFDALYMTVITLSTTGFLEVRPLSPAGRSFTMILLIIGMGLVAYFVTNVAQFIMEGRLLDFWGRQRMRERIKAMRGHYIICGAGSTGLVVAEEFGHRRVEFVIVDQNPKVVGDLRLRGFAAIDGDATLDATLMDAGLAAAKGLIAALPHDADNVFVTLTAKGLNPDIYVVSSASRDESVSKLRRAGANYVVTPNAIGGHRMASVVLRPSVVDFLDVTSSGEVREFQMEEIVIRPGAALENQAIRDADLRRRSGAIIVSVKQGDRMHINPEPGLVFRAGDRLIVLGHTEQLERMAQIATEPADPAGSAGA